MARGGHDRLEKDLLSSVTALLSDGGTPCVCLVCSSFCAPCWGPLARDVKPGPSSRRGQGRDAPVSSNVD